MENYLDLQDDIPAEGGSSSSSAQKSLPIRPLLRMVRRKILLIAAIPAATIGAAWLSTASDLPTYNGGFRLLVEPVTSEARIAEPTALSRTDGGVPGEGLFQLDYPTQLEILRSPKVMQPVVETVQTKYPEFHYGRLISGLTIQRAGGKTKSSQTKILEVAYQDYDPEVADLVLNEVAKQFLKYSLEDRKSRIGEGVKFIEDQLPELQERVDGLEAEIQALQQNYELLDPGSQGEAVIGQLQDIGNQQLSTQQALQEQRTLYATLQQRLQLSPDEAISVSALSQDPRYQQILNNLNEIDAQIATESTRFTEESPTVRRLREKQANLSSLLSQRAQQILGRAPVRTNDGAQDLTFQDGVRLGMIQQLVDTANQMQVLEVRNRILSQNRDLVERQVRAFPTIARRYNELQRQLSIATRTLDQLLSQRESLRVAAAQTQIPWELVSEPRLFRDSTGAPIPNTVDSKKKLMMGGAVGLAIALGAAFLLEKKEDVFYSSGDIKDLIPAPLLGSIPVYSDGDPAKDLMTVGHLDDAAGELSQDAYAFKEAFNSLYASLRFLNANSMVRSLVIGSATPGDGKTTTALHLAQTAAATGQRVLLVDANFRSSQIHKKLGISNSQGLFDLLTKRLPFDQVVQRPPGDENLYILTSGQVSNGATRLLASPQMKTLMEKFHTNFDLVIYDTPDFQTAVDANFLAANAEGILMVASVRQTSRSKMSQTLNALKEFHLPIIGTVANRATAPATSVDDVEEDDDGFDERQEPIALVEGEPAYQQLMIPVSPYAKDPLT